MSYFNASIKIPSGNDIDLTDTTGKIISIKSGTLGADFVNFTLPTSNGTNGQVLSTDGSGNLSYTTVSAGSLAADNLTEGDDNVLLSTSAGNVYLKPSNGDSIYLSDGLSNIVTIASNVVSTSGNIVMDTNKSLVFRDSALSINSSTDGQLDIGADTLVKITSTTANVTGNLETSGTLNVANDLTASSNVDVSGNVNVTKNVVVTGNLTASSNVNVSGNVNVTKNVVVTGDLTVNGTTTTINSNVTTIDDPVIELGTAGVGESFDRGIRYHYHETTAKNGFFGLDRSESVFTFYSDATFTASNVVASGTLGNARFSGITANATTNSTSVTTGALVVNGGVGIANDIYAGNNLHLASDAAVLNFGADNDITLTHVADTGLLLNSTSELQFNTSASKVYSAATGFLNLNASNIVLTATNSNVSGVLNVLDTTEATQLTGGTGALIVEGGAYIKDNLVVANAITAVSNVDIEGELNVANGNVLVSGTGEIQLAGTTNKIYSTVASILNIEANNTLLMTATTANVDGNFETTGNVTTAGDLSIGNTLFVGVDSITTTTAAAEIITSTLKSSVKSFKLNNGTALTYHSNAGVSGQMLHIFYDNLNAAGSANIDFGVDGLYVGSGTARYLKFTQTGQSATMIFIDGADANSAGWRIINTGGTVS
jgi:hypothetical protein